MHDSGIGSSDTTLRVWDAATGAQRLVITVLEEAFSVPEIAFAARREEFREEFPHRATDHSFHHGYDGHEVKDDLAVFIGGRHRRICRFIPARTAA